MIPNDYLHRDPLQWQNPGEFLPDRWDILSPLFKRPDGENRHPLSFNGFGGGVRQCVGKSFSEIMSRGICALLLHEYEFRVVGDLEKPVMNLSGPCVAKVKVEKVKRRS
jgi:cytochrome P450